MEGDAEKQSADRFNFENIRALLNNGFDDQELRQICYDHFRPVHDKLAEGTGKIEIVNRLVEFADNKMCIERLLAVVKERIPEDRYNRHQPYIVRTPAPTPVSDVRPQTPTDQTGTKPVEPVSPTIVKSPNLTPADIEKLLQGPPEGFVQASEHFVMGQWQPVPHVVVDQHTAVTAFVSMVVPRWRKDDKHLLLIEAGSGQGKTQALNRFEWLCHALRMKLILLHAKLDFIAGGNTASELASRILDKLGSAAEHDVALQSQARSLCQLRDVLDQGSPERGRVEGDKRSEWKSLTKKLYACLDEVSRQSCTIVLLFDNYHCLDKYPDAAGWFKDYFLPMVKDEHNKNLILVITGEDAFKELKEWDGVKYLTSISDIEVEDIQRLAKLKYHVDNFPREKAREILVDVKEHTGGLIDMGWILTLLKHAIGGTTGSVVDSYPK